ncbi:MAG: hypothetical protein ACRCYO_03380, partial [Bacteroidia bacterium]
RDARKHFTSQFRTDIADRVPYYGYTSWAKDVIADFEGNNDDTTLEALARAYEHYANGFLDGRMGDRLPEQQTGTLDERLNVYVTNMDKSIDAYSRLEKQNPNYEVLIGGIHTKYGNTKMAAWYDLNQAGRDDLAKKYLSEKLYDPLILSIVRNTLNSCPKDAIFFSFGDNDTYPFMYVQQAEGVRKDVHVINLSLLNIPSYIESIRAKGVSFTIKPEMYKSMEYVKFDGDGMTRDTVSWNDFIASLQIDAAQERASTTPKVIQIPQAFYNDSLVIKPLLVFKQQMILTGEVAMIDLMLSNIGKHPVCFSIYCADMPFNSRDLTQTCFYFNLFAHPNNVNVGSMSGPFGELNLDAAWNEFSVHSNFDTTSSDRYFGQRLVGNFRFQLSQFASAFAAKDQPKAKAILEKSETLFPNKNWPYDFSAYYIFDAYCMLGDLKKAEETGMLVIQNIMESLKKEKGENLQYETQKTRSTVSYINEKAKGSGMTRLEEKAKEALATIDGGLVK